MATAVILLHNGTVQQCEVFTGGEASENYDSIRCITNILYNKGFGDKHDIEPDDIEDTDTAFADIDIEVRRVLEGTGFEIVWLDDVTVDGFHSYHKDPQFKNQ